VEVGGAEGATVCLSSVGTRTKSKWGAASTTQIQTRRTAVAAVVAAKHRQWQQQQQQQEEEEECRRLKLRHPHAQE